MIRNLISFPNAGLDFTINETAFTVFNVEIKWYAIILTLGIVCACLYALFRSKQQGIPSDCVVDYAIFAVIFGIIGARLFYVLTTLDQYDSFLDMINIRNGGLAIYGSIIGGALAIVFVARYKKMKVLNMFDMIAPGVMYGQVIGRFGNFVNGEAFGSISDKYFLFGRTFTQKGCGKLPWIMKVTEVNDGVAGAAVTAHPTFLYEACWNLAGFILINIFYRKKKFNGQIFYAYIAWYGFGRMLIEGLRSDSLMIGSQRISQLIGLSCFVIGTVLLFAGKRLAGGVCGEPRANEIAEMYASKAKKKKTAAAAKSTAVTAEETEDTEETDDSSVNTGVPEEGEDDGENN